MQTRKLYKLVPLFNPSKKGPRKHAADQSAGGPALQSQAQCMKLVGSIDSVANGRIQSRVYPQRLEPLLIIKAKSTPTSKPVSIIVIARSLARSEKCVSI